MTCIAGVKHKGRVWIGGDSAGCASWDITIRRDAKVFRNGPFVIGFTSSFRMGQLIRYAFKPPRLPESIDDLDRYMVVDFVGGLRQCLKDGGWAERKDEQEKGGFFLVGIHDRLFKIEADYQVGEAADAYDACGCGEGYAKGALFTADENADPFTRITRALDAAAHHSNGVHGPFVILSTNPGPGE